MHRRIFTTTYSENPNGIPYEQPGVAAGYPGTTDLIHKTYPEGIAESLDLTSGCVPSAIYVQTCGSARPRPLLLKSLDHTTSFSLLNIGDATKQWPFESIGYVR